VIRIGIISIVVVVHTEVVSGCAGGVGVLIKSKGEPHPQFLNCVSKLMQEQGMFPHVLMTAVYDRIYGGLELAQVLIDIICETVAKLAEVCILVLIALVTIVTVTIPTGAPALAISCLVMLAP
jgi:hypothetical protein